eukprot:GHVR01140047.1.p2 GENE.GHVR01140047.1~~GHVR01140047.1.p2  ORF type:complete len:102 (-),score=62.12 GHVR01140047.1:188-493(-)
MPGGPEEHTHTHTQTHTDTPTHTDIQTNTNIETHTHTGTPVDAQPMTLFDPPCVPTVSKKVISDAKKLATYAISALEFSDVDGAIEQFELALKLLKPPTGG